MYQSEMFYGDISCSKCPCKTLQEKDEGEKGWEWEGIRHWDPFPRRWMLHAGPVTDHSSRLGMHNAGFTMPTLKSQGCNLMFPRYQHGADGEPRAAVCGYFLLLLSWQDKGMPSTGTFVWLWLPS